MHPEDNVKTPALRTVGNIVTGDDTQTAIVMGNQVLPRLMALLCDQKKGIRKEACWTVSNITAGVCAVVRLCPLPSALSSLHSALRQHTSALSSLHSALRQHTSAQTFPFSLLSGNQEQIQQVLAANLIPPLVAILRSAHFDIQKEVCVCVCVYYPCNTLVTLL
jgi:hypothetical protein